MSDYLFDKSGKDPEVEGLEELLGVYRHRAPLGALPPRRRPRRRAITAVVVLAAAAIALWLWARPRPAQPVLAAGACAKAGPGFAFSVENGPARCDGAAATRGRLPVGAWLETTGAAVAELRLADIGELSLHGDSRLRLVGTDADEHRLELARGRVTARVVAPPRLFVVDTPSATAFDLGCAYELVVDDDGRTHLRVTSGAVSLEGHGKTSYAPAFAEVVALPGRGPGTPVAFTATAELRDAVARFDAGDPAALTSIVALAGETDTITLWNLLGRISAEQRFEVMTRLEGLRARPLEVRREAVLEGDPEALERWRLELQLDWDGSTRAIKSHR